MPPSCNLSSLLPSLITWETMTSKPFHWTPIYLAILIDNREFKPFSNNMRNYDFKNFSLNLYVFSYTNRQQRIQAFAQNLNQYHLSISLNLCPCISLCNRACILSRIPDISHARADSLVTKLPNNGVTLWFNKINSPSATSILAFLQQSEFILDQPSKF